MVMKIRILTKIISYFAAVAILPLLSSCVSEEPVPPGGDKEVSVMATVSPEAYTKAYQESGIVKEGTYYLTYPTTVASNYEVADVNFNVDAENPQIGIATAPGNQSLKWAVVGGGSTPTFSLDNVPPLLGVSGSSSTEILLDSDNPFKAAPFDSIEGTNDLLWGSKMVNRNAETVNFDLQHNMSRVRVQITADSEYEQTEGDLSLEGAVVEITRINQTPISFNRLDGTLGLDRELDSYTSMTIVNDNEGGIRWLHSATNPDQPTLTTYYSGDFVLPPQQLLEDVNRPRLKITLKNGNTYSGILPSAMLIYDGSHQEPSYPVALSFLPQYVLTIRTVITEQPPTLSFMPVYVMKWVDKGDFSIEAHQAGIYTAKEFTKLIEYYNAGNLYQLPRYGKKVVNDGVESWNFDFWHGVTLNYEDIAGKMPVNSAVGNFSFSFNNFRISVIKGGEATTVSASVLYDIVTGRTTWP